MIRLAPSPTGLSAEKIQECFWQGTSKDDSKHFKIQPPRVHMIIINACCSANCRIHLRARLPATFEDSDTAVAEIPSV